MAKSTDKVKQPELGAEPNEKKESAQPAAGAESAEGAAMKSENGEGAGPDQKEDAKQGDAAPPQQDTAPAAGTVGLMIDLTDIDGAVANPKVLAFCQDVAHRARMDETTNGEVPTMSDDEINAAAQNEQGVEIAKRIVEAAKRINAEKNKPAPLTDEEVAAAAHQRLVDRYGKDFVTAKKGKDSKYFSRQNWNNLPKGKYGWVELTKEMPEAAKQ